MTAEVYKQGTELFTECNTSSGNSWIQTQSRWRRVNLAIQVVRLRITSIIDTKSGSNVVTHKDIKYCYY